MVEVRRNRISNAIGGLLAGYGFVAFFCFLVLVEHWAHIDPQQPEPSRGFIFAHNEHGAVTYFSGFQGTSCAVLIATSIPLGALGILILPKKNVVRRVGFLSVFAKWNQDDPQRISKIAYAIGAIIAPV